MQRTLSVDLAKTVYALDATTIDLCLSLFPWAKFRTTKAAVKLHTLLDLRGAIPSFIHISDGKLHDVNVLDLMIAEPGAFYVMDRGYLDFERLYACISRKLLRYPRQTQLQFKRVYPRPVDRSTGLICDQKCNCSASTPSRLSRTPASHPLPRSRRATVGVPDQSYHVSAFDDLRVVPVPMAGRTVLQVDQATPAHQALLRHLGERREDQVWIAVSVYVLVAIVRKGSIWSCRCTKCYRF